MSIGPRFGLNYKAEFKNNSNYNHAVNPGLPTGGTTHIYDDGYVDVDSSGNLGGLTTYWGYQNASQYVGGGIAYHAMHSVDDSSSEDYPQYGFEIIYQRILGVLSNETRSLWGIEVGVGYTDLKLDNHLGTVSVTIDTFPLGVVPPSASYSGSFSGPGALMGDTPVRTFGTAAFSSNQSLDGELFSIRIGPFIERQLTHHLSLLASVGFTLAPTRLNYAFIENDPLVPGISADGQTSRKKLLYGPYVSANFCYHYNDSWSIYTGVQYQSLNDMNLSVGSRSSRFDPGDAIDLTAGMMWRF